MKPEQAWDSTNCCDEDADGDQHLTAIYDSYTVQPYNL